MEVVYPGLAFYGLLIGAGLLAMSPAFAETAVTISKGDSLGPNCASAKDCFDSDSITVAPGTLVTWNNSDIASHTVTSGSPSDNQTGTVFDSGLIKPGKTYSFNFKNSGIYHYFCQLHPWMAGVVNVASSVSSTTAPSEPPANVNIPSTSGVSIISITDGSSNHVTGCGETDTCLKPSLLYVNSGSSVTWTNNDTASHEIVYGSPGLAGSSVTLFDSGMMTPGQAYSYHFGHAGFYPYYDKTHPWEMGLVIVKP